MAEAKYKVVWPLGKSAYEIASPAYHDPDLKGKTICELWDFAFRGDEIFPAIREALLERYPGIKFVDYATFGNIHGTKEAEVIAALPGRIREHGCEGVISGIGA